MNAAGSESQIGCGLMRGGASGAVFLDSGLSLLWIGISLAGCCVVSSNGAAGFFAGTGQVSTARRWNGETEGMTARCHREYAGRVH